MHWATILFNESKHNIRALVGHGQQTGLNCTLICLFLQYVVGWNFDPLGQKQW
jgi:hypothetical protein